MTTNTELQDTKRSESKLESAIVNKMQQFLLEMGKGFLFEARQKRFTFDEENFYQKSSLAIVKKLSLT